METDTHLQSIFTYLLIYLFISKALRKERPSMFPKSGGPMETDFHSRALLDISFRVPSKWALPPGPPHGVPSERDAPFVEPSFIHQSQSPPDSRCPSEISHGTVLFDHLWRILYSCGSLRRAGDQRRENSITNRVWMCSSAPTDD
jgi:hypothetical protein